MSAIILDTETTGRGPGARPVEIAWLRLKDIATLEVVEEFYSRYNPEKRIDFGAMAIHHITDADVRDCEPWTTFKLPEGTEYVIAHNVDFDIAVIGSPPVRRIDTLALARYCWPDMGEMDSYSLGALLYAHAPEVARATRAEHGHGTRTDVRHCHIILAEILLAIEAAQEQADARDERITDWRTLWRCSEAARIPVVLPFGKHRGQRFADVPQDYLRWLLRQPDLDPYVRIAAEGNLRQGGLR